MRSLEQKIPPHLPLSRQGGGYLKIGNKTKNNSKNKEHSFYTFLYLFIPFYTLLYLFIPFYTLFIPFRPFIPFYTFL